MGYDYSSRDRLAKRFFENWKKENASRIDKADKKLFEEALKIGKTYSTGTNIFEDMVKEQYSPDKYCKPSDFMREKLGSIINIFVPAKYIDDYYNIIDEFHTFQYTTGYSRRSFRTDDFNCHIYHAIKLMYCYMSFEIYGVSAADYLRDNLTPELLDYKRNIDSTFNDVAIRHADDILAARINAGDTGVIEAIKEAILSENNTVIVTREMILAIVKSKNGELHEILGKFLVAARLSEGIRQVICECSDEGRLDAFTTLLKVIAEENLVRFAAVKRAFAVWTGFIDENNIDRIIGKVMPLMLSSINDLDAAEELLKTDDSINIMTGLWALAANDVKFAMTAMEHIARAGSKVQKITISYFNRMLQNRDFTERVARYVVENNEDDIELIAGFMPTYFANPERRADLTFKINRGSSYDISNESDYTHYKLPVTNLIPGDTDGSVARKHYEILKKNLAKLGKKTMEFSPFIFPWYSTCVSRGDFVMRMAVLAYALEDEAYIDEVCPMITDINGQYVNRSTFIRMLLHEPKNEIQRQTVINCVADKETYARKTAYSILKTMDLRKDEYETLSGFLKYKNEETRKYVITLLKRQSKADLTDNIKTMLKDKNDNMRLAAFDMLKTGFEDDKATAKMILDESGLKDSLTEQEKVLWNEISGGGDKASVEEGYGLYDVNASLVIPEAKPDMKVLKEYFNVSKLELDEVFIKLNDYFIEHGDLEYKVPSGETKLLANGIFCTSYDRNKKTCDNYPFKELWQAFYDEHIHSEKLLKIMDIAISGGYDASTIVDIEGYRAIEKNIISEALSGYKLPDMKTGPVSGRRIYSDIRAIVNIMLSFTGAKIPKDVALAASEYMALIPEDKRWFIEPERSYIKTRDYDSFTSSHPVSTLIYSLLIPEYKKEGYEKIFFALRRLDLAYEYQKHEKKSYYSQSSQRNFLTVYEFIYAYLKGIITKDYLYKYFFEELPLELVVQNLGIFSGRTIKPYELSTLAQYMPVNEEKNTADTDNEFFKTGKELYDSITNLILDVELKRGDTETDFSKASKKIDKVYGIRRLGQILTAMGKDTLDRSTYYYFSSGTGKKECLSHLLQVCYPIEGEKASDLKSIKVSEDRLIEVAMYAPQWIDLIEEYLKCDGLKSGCYYFMAHMNERFDDKRKAIIAKYTPLDAEELNQGAFDLDWFFESYNKLGDKMFQKLYKAAKYISDGNKHSRARKYADAALGQVDRDSLETEINSKRNKDLIMSYGLIPVKDEKDKLHRYEYIQKFLKESKQFGAQRRASEKTASEMALRNLATASGYADSLRLILAMETAIISENRKFFDGITVDNYCFKINISGDGKAELLTEKAGKIIKSVPAAFKKNESVLEIKDFVTKLKDQYSRTVKMLENSMEERDEFTVSELLSLCANPVIKAILTKLIYIGGESFYVISDDCKFEPAIANSEKAAPALSDDAKMRVAHPYDMYVSSSWSALQETVFSWANNGKKFQPFKQVFRELYIKLPEESDQSRSRMFAGNQIQPQKTVATLKNRRWIADYEDGLQKIYYKDNIIATIYALADWFSPSDIEAPTLEYVQFYDRKTFEEKKISEIPDILYSEVMRDVDLAVSVAHAGGVDPETSHSTIELRKAVIGFNLKLFKLTNVRLEGTHAFVTGKYGEYTIHLGSGVTHKKPGVLINVLPVHSQSRGKIFLPFIDEDPKTAEILSKIILFAEDSKIKDPFIMEQIVK